VMLFGPDLRHLFADGQELTRLGVEQGTLKGKTVDEAFPPGVAETLTSRYEEALTGSEVSFELVYDGRTYQGQALPVGHAETATGMVVLQDVTEQRRMESLTALEQARTTFFNNVSHELRTPLTLLLGPLQEILGGPPERLTPQIREQVEISHR